MTRESARLIHRSVVIRGETTLRCVIPSRTDGERPRGCNTGLLASYSAKNMSDADFAEGRG
jgi:hypothetical protein